MLIYRWYSIHGQIAELSQMLKHNIRIHKISKNSVPGAMDGNYEQISPRDRFIGSSAWIPTKVYA